MECVQVCVREREVYNLYSSCCEDGSSVLVLACVNAVWSCNRKWMDTN